MICPKPCRQKIQGGNKLRIHGIWKHKKCPRTVWQIEEIIQINKKAEKIRIKLGWE